MKTSESSSSTTTEAFYSQLADSGATMTNGRDRLAISRVLTLAMMENSFPRGPSRAPVRDD